MISSATQIIAIRRCRFVLRNHMFIPPSSYDPDQKEDYELEQHLEKTKIEEWAEIWSACFSSQKWCHLMRSIALNPVLISKTLNGKARNKYIYLVTERYGSDQIYEDEITELFSSLRKGTYDKQTDEHMFPCGTVLNIQNVVGLKHNRQRDGQAIVPPPTGAAGDYHVGVWGDYADNLFCQKSEGVLHYIFYEDPEYATRTLSKTRFLCKSHNLIRESCMLHLQLPNGRPLGISFTRKKRDWNETMLCLARNQSELVFPRFSLSDVLYRVTRQVGERSAPSHMEYLRNCQKVGERELWEMGLLEWGFDGVRTKTESCPALLVIIKPAGHKANRNGNRKKRANKRSTVK